MAKNLELKLKVDSHEEILERIKEIGAERAAALNQTDTYFKIDSGLLKLREFDGKNELIKYLRNEAGGERWSDYQVLNIEGEEVKGFFCSLFPVETVVKKTRVLYLYDDTRIHLDTVESLGTFIELETLVLDGDETDAKKRFDKIVELLRLPLGKQLKTSYRNLMLEK
ncbi:MAG: CYTH domain-containing protein [Chlorobi bacterium]|nr:CYTH domain-containing protein [Chlorobiota bacterium]